MQSEQQMCGECAEFAQLDQTEVMSMMRNI